MRAEISNSAIHQIGKLKLQPKEFINKSFLYLIVLVLLVSGLAKIIDPLPLIKTIEAFKLFSDTINIFISTTLPILEIGLAVLLLMKVNLKITLSLTLLLFASFLFYAIYGYFLGIKNDCGCFGDIIKSEFGVGMIVRNIFLLVVVGYLAAKKIQEYLLKHY